MTNDDPKQTILALCDIKEPIINYGSYKKKYEELFRNGKTISTEHADAHFYLLSQFELLTEIQESQYKISSAGRYICELLQTKREMEYKKVLAVVLLNNSKKKMLFREFLEFVKRSKSIDEIKDEFSKIIKNRKVKYRETHRTLIAWCEEANLITKHTSKRKTYVAATSREPSKKYTLEEFWQELVKTYKDIQKASGHGSKMIYVSIGELRLRVSCQLGFLDTTEFDQYLSRLLSSREFRLYIRLHGAPTHAYEFMETFTYRGKAYPLISLVV